jgi:DNA repair exonuclease SbcCD ATPase subunit
MNKKFEDLWDEIKTQRDELRVQAHLAKVEVQDEIEVLEERWQKLESHAADLRQETGEAFNEFRNASHVVLEELSGAYKRIKDRIAE